MDNKVEFPYAKNVYFSRYDCAYLIGAMMATAFPHENVFGFISNFQTVYTDMYVDGFKAGLQSIRPKTNVSSVYTKSYNNDEIAYQLIKEQNIFGINVFMSTLSPQSNEGVYRYAKENEKSDKPIYTTCLGVDETAPNNPYILTGITENIELALRLVISEFFYHGHNLNTVQLGLADNGADVLFATTQDVNYRNEKIMTESVIAADKRAYQQVKEKNKRLRKANEIQETKDNQIIIRGTILQKK